MALNRLVADLHWTEVAESSNCSMSVYEVKAVMESIKTNAVPS